MAKGKGDSPAGRFSNMYVQDFLPDGQHLQLPVKQRKCSQKKIMTSGAYKDYKIWTIDTSTFPVDRQSLQNSNKNTSSAKAVTRANRTGNISLMPLLQFLEALMLRNAAQAPMLTGEHPKSLLL